MLVGLCAAVWYGMLVKRSTPPSTPAHQDAPFMQHDFHSKDDGSPSTEEHYAGSKQQAQDAYAASQVRSTPPLAAASSLPRFPCPWPA